MSRTTWNAFHGHSYSANSSLRTLQTQDISDQCHFGTGAEMPKQFGPIKSVLKCLCDEVSDYPVKIIMLVVIYCFANVHRIILLAGNITQMVYNKLKL